MDTRDHLQALLTEAAQQHTHFEKLQQRKAAWLIALFPMVMLTPITPMAGLPPTITISLTLIVMDMTSASLLLTLAEKDDLDTLGNEWQSHLTEATLLLHAMDNDRAGRQTTDDDMMELEEKMIETRVNSLCWNRPTRKADSPQEKAG